MQNPKNFVPAVLAFCVLGVACSPQPTCEEAATNAANANMAFGDAISGTQNGPCSVLCEFNAVSDAFQGQVKCNSFPAADGATIVGCAPDECTISRPYPNPSGSVTLTGLKQDICVGLADPTISLTFAEADACAYYLSASHSGQTYYVNATNQVVKGAAVNCPPTGAPSQKDLYTPWGDQSGYLTCDGTTYPTPTPGVPMDECDPTSASTCEDIAPPTQDSCPDLTIKCTFAYGTSKLPQGTYCINDGGGGCSCCHFKKESGDCFAPGFSPLCGPTQPPCWGCVK